MLVKRKKNCNKIFNQTGEATSTYHGSLYQTGLYSDTNLTHRNSMRTIIDTNEIFFETNHTYFAMNWIIAKEARNIFYINLQTL